MSGEENLWSSTISVRVRDPQLIRWVADSLGPEAAREVPRASAKLRTPRPDTLVLSIAARDAGALRAALNTYLGWVELSLATARAADAPRRSGDRRT